MAFLADGPIGSQSSELASAITGKGEFAPNPPHGQRHGRRPRPGAASPGPTRIALAVSGSFRSGIHKFTITACNCAATA